MSTKEFFTLQTMLTLTGASSATVIIANSIQYAFNVSPRWLALLIAEVISNVGVYVNHGLAIDYFVGIVNGFLIFCTAVGASQMVGRRRSRGAARGVDDLRTSQETGDSRRHFFTAWF
jgi:hypothetical protein